MSDRDYHGAITIMPDGRVYTGERETNVPANTKLYAKMSKVTKSQWNDGLKAKAIPKQQRTNALFANIVNNNLSLAAATTIANSSNLTHLQLIRLFEAAQGTPDEYFHTDNMFVERSIDQLQYRETFYDTTQTAEYLGRREEAKSTATIYDEIEYDLPKLVDKVFTPIEDIIRTIINPQAVDLEQIAWGMRRRRNQEAINTVALIANSQTQLGSPADIGSNFHSTNNTGNDLLELFKSFLVTNDVGIDHVLMSPTMYARYTSNTWTEDGGPNGLAPKRLPSGGVVPLRGIEGVTAVVDAMVTNDDVMYAVNKRNALRLGQGPVIMRRYYDEERDSEAIKKLDFNQYIAVKSQITKLTREFGMTIPFDAAP